MLFIYNRNDKNVPYSGDKENPDYCISRERRIEIAILEYMEEQHGIHLLRYLDDTAPIYDNFLIRSSIPAYYNSALRMHKLCCNNINNINTILSWASIQLKEFTKRRIIELPVGSLLNNQDLIVNNFANDKGQIFIKTQEKGFSYCSTTDYMDQLGYHCAHKGPSSMMIVSEVVNFLREYRCFVVNNKVVCISEYKDYEILVVPDEVWEFATNVVNYLSYNDFVTNYVLDVGVTSDRGLAVVEFNDVGLAGRYINNDFCAIVEAFTGHKCDKPYSWFVEQHDEKNVSYFRIQVTANNLLEEASKASNNYLGDISHLSNLLKIKNITG